MLFFDIVKNIFFFDKDGPDTTVNCGERVEEFVCENNKVSGIISTS